MAYLLSFVLFGIFYSFNYVCICGRFIYVYNVDFLWQDIICGIIYSFNYYLVFMADLMHLNTGCGTFLSFEGMCGRFCMTKT